MIRRPPSSTRTDTFFPYTTLFRSPQLLDAKLWEASGHWGKFRENMFVVPDEVPGTDPDKPVLTGAGDLMALKPMNCPAHVQVFKQGITSYRDLPLRLAEFGCCHRNEPHGARSDERRVGIEGGSTCRSRWSRYQ